MKRKKLFAGMVIISVAVLILGVFAGYLGYLSHRDYEKTVVLQTQKQLLMIAKSTSRSLKEYIAEYLEALQTISRNPSVQKELSEKSLHDKSDIEYCPLKVLYEIHKGDMDILTILDANGIMLHRHPFIANWPEMDYTDKPGVAYVLMEHKAYVSEVFYNNSGNLAISISEPIFYDDEFAGMVRWMVELNTISKLFVEPVKVGKKGYAWIFDNKDIILSHPTKEFIGISVLDAIRKMHAERSETFDESRLIDHIREEHDYINRLKAEEEGYGIFIDCVTDENNIVAYRRVSLGETTWNLIVTLPYSEIAGPIHKNAKNIFGLAGIVISLFGIGGAVFLRMQKRKAELETETKYLREIAKSEEALQKAHDELEQRVEERTAELQREVIERKHIQEQLKNSKTMLQAIFDGISDPLLMVGKDMSVKVLNKPAAEYYQVELQTAIGKPCYQTFEGRSTLCEGCDIPSAVSRGKAVTFERKGVADPDKFEQVVIYPLKEKKGEEGGSIVRISDITEAKLMERQVIQSEKMASLGLLVAGVAHEINNPNNFITFNIPILRDYLKKLMPILDDYARVRQDFELFGMSYPEFRKDIFKLLDNVEHGSSRINAIVSDLKEYAGSRDKAERRLVDIKTVIEKGVALCTGEIKKKVKSFEMNIPEGFPKIFTNPEAVEQVLVNILINAVHAADKEDSYVRLNVRLVDTPRDHLMIEVSDNGCGMDEKTMGKIFDPFFTTKAVGIGTGLGLFVSHSSIEGLGGRIEVESKEGAGSMFRIILPVKNGPSQNGAISPNQLN